MSVEDADTSADLDHDRLSVTREAEPPEGGGSVQSEFGSRLDLSEVPVSSDGSVRVTVEEGDVRSPESMRDLVECHRDYLEAKEDAVLVLQEQESGDVMVMPHIHRWKAQYRRKTYAKLAVVEEYAQSVWGEIVPTTFLTLTAPHERPDGSPRPFVDVLEDMKESYQKVRKIVHKETEGLRTECVAVWEPHKTGYPHLHIAVLGTASNSLGDRVRQLWTEKYLEDSSAAAQHCEVRNGRSAQVGSPLAYLMKYLGKSLTRSESVGSGEDDIESRMPTIRGFEAFSALLWATQKRQWSVTQGLSEAMKEAAPESETTGSWEFIGAFRGLDLGVYSGDDARRLGKFLRGSREEWRPPRKQGPSQQGLPPPD